MSNNDGPEPLVLESLAAMAPLQVVASPAAVAPRMDWRDMGEDEHFVQFYETDKFLLDCVGDFVINGLRSGDVCIVVVKPENLAGLEERLLAGGIDTNAAKDAGSYVTLDAEQALARFVVDGRLDSERFAEIFGAVIASATQRGRRVRIFGEMVALLWAQGNVSATVELEALWNTLRAEYSFALFCAYPLYDGNGKAYSEPITHVCDRHSRVLPAESYNALESDADRLRAIALLQQKARLLEAEIVERQKAEDALLAALAREQAARAEVEKADRMKDDFLATLSHELRTPLHSILGWTQLLTAGQLDEPISRQGLEVIERNVRNQALLVDDLLDVSRIIAGRMTIEPGPQNLQLIVASALAMVQTAATEKQIEIVTDFAADPYVSGDAHRLQQVLWNLLQNAVKFSSDGQQVRVHLEADTNDARVSISDNGIGIAPEFLPQLFDRFHQADGTATRKYGGLGLGLSIARHLAELHGGTITASSNGENQGATFIVELPLLKD